MKVTLQTLCGCTQELEFPGLDPPPTLRMSLRRPVIPVNNAKELAPHATAWRVRVFELINSDSVTYREVWEQ